MTMMPTKPVLGGPEVPERAVPEREPRGPRAWAHRAGWAVADSTVVARRYLAHLVYKPDEVIGTLMIPVLAVLLFGFVFGEAMGAAMGVGGEDSELSQIVVEPWPSDHRAVVSEFDVVAKPIRDLAPTITTDSPVYDPGEPIAVDFLGAVDGGRITIDKPSSKAPERLARTDAQAGTLVFDGTEAGRRWPLTPGEYVVNLRSRGNVTASTSVVVRDASMLPSLELNANVYAAGDPITVTFANAAGNATDWIGLYRAGDTPGSVGSRYWQYVGGGQVPTAADLDGSVAFSADEPGEGSASWPPDPGEYVAYLLEADGYRILAQAGFTVT
jgi:hypothetical protein